MPTWILDIFDILLTTLICIPFAWHFFLRPLRTAIATSRRDALRLMSLQASFLDCQITIDATGCILEWNSASEQTLGWSAAEAIGQSLSTLIVPPHLHHAHTQGISHFLATGEGPILNKRIEVPAVCKDGREIVTELTVSAIQTDDQVLFTAALRDITERKQAEDTLRQSEERYRTLTEHSPLAVAVYYESRIVYVNPAAMTMFGAKSPDQIIGRSIYDFIHPDFHALARTRAHKSQREGCPSPLAEQKYLRVDGTVIDVESASTTTTWEGHPAGQVLIRDITAHKQADAARKKAEERYRSLFENMAEGIFQSSPDGRLLLVNPAMARMMGYDTPEENLAAITDLKKQLYVNPADRKVFLARMQSEGFYYGFETEFYRRDGSIASVSLNVRAVRDQTGQVVSFDGTVEDITERKRAETKILELNQQMEQRLDRIVLLNYELEQAYDTTIQGWSRALDFRDRETEGHSQRVTEMTVRLAEMLEMTPAEIAQIRRGALLHDIGKMAIPDAILLKPGPLTEAEWVLMRQHPDLARTLLDPIEFLRPALEIPYCHHEKWDGTGYPRGLKGDQIPLAARAFAIVDVWDALRSDRPYRAAWSVERVCDHISGLAGTHFDPDLVPLFLEMHRCSEAEPAYFQNILHKLAA